MLELRARVDGHPDQLEVRAPLHARHRARHVLERDAELRLVVARRDVHVRRVRQVDARVDAHRNPRPARDRPRTRLDARNLLDALHLHRPDAQRAARERLVELVVLLRDPAVDDPLRDDAARQRHAQLRAAHDVRAASLARQRPYDGACRVRLHGIRDEVRRPLERRVEIASARSAIPSRSYTYEGVPCRCDHVLEEHSPEKKASLRVPRERHASFE